MKNEKNHECTLRTQDCYNPFFLYKDDKQIGVIDAINFFKIENGEGMVIATCKWFSIKRFKSNKAMYICSNNDFELVHLPYSDVKRQNKLQFGKADAFYMKSYNGEFNLFLNVDNLKDFNVTSAEPQEIYNGSEVNVHDIVTFDVQGVSRRVSLDGHEDSTFTACFTCNYKNSLTDFGMLCDKIASKLSTGISEMRRYDIAKLIVSGEMDKIVELYTAYKGKLSENR